MSSQNPYAPPVAEVRDISGADSEAEEIRNEHIKHEASLRSVGTLYYIGGTLTAIGLIGLLAAGAATTLEGPLTILLPVYGVLVVAGFVLGYGMRRLKTWVRIPALILAALGLLAFPLGTLVNAYILYLLLSKKGARILQPDYADIVAATPHIKYRTSIVVWIVLGILVLGVLAAIVIPMYSGR